MRIDLARRAATLALAGMLPLMMLAQAVGQTSTSPSAQAWPQRPIRMICPFPAGGGTDFIARLAAKHLSDRLGQQVYVENRGGANGAIGLPAAPTGRAARPNASSPSTAAAPSSASTAPPG